MQLFKKRGALKTATDLELNNAEQYFENITNDNDDQWFDQEYEEGQLSIDVYQTADKLIIKSTIAGVKPEDIDISLHNDMLTIRGKRETEEIIDKADYLYKECYWGTFSRSLILPLDIRTDKLEAFLENGVLTISLLKSKKPKQVSIKVKER